MSGTDGNGCTDQTTVTIQVLQDVQCNEIFVPTIFSPNASGPVQNEKLCVYSNCIREMEWAIYDRWGRLLYETKDPKACWDGTNDGATLITGVYVYSLRIVQTDGKEVKKTGTLTLVK